MDTRQEFLELYNTYIKREGAASLLNWLENKSDFFTAPASAKFHLACEGGLVTHSLSVAKLMLRYEDEDKESLAICGLLHDLCKTNYYKVSMRNVKNDVTGQWEKQPFYQVEDSFPFGHGEKSVYMIERFFKLSGPEAMAIRWHMGFSGTEDSRTVGKAFAKYPLAFALSVADMEATYFLEEEGNPF